MNGTHQQDQRHLRSTTANLAAIAALCGGLTLGGVWGGGAPNLYDPFGALKPKGKPAASPLVSAPGGGVLALW